MNEILSHAIAAAIDILAVTAIVEIINKLRGKKSQGSFFDLELTTPKSGIPRIQLYKK